MSQDPAEEAAMPYDPGDESEPVSVLAAVKQRHEQRLMAIDGVQGVGIGADEVGDEAIVVYLRDEGSKNRVPDALESFPVRFEDTGEIEAY